jgi:hypothetical protein
MLSPVIYQERTDIIITPGGYKLRYPQSTMAKIYLNMVNMTVLYIEYNDDSRDGIAG